MFDFNDKVIVVTGAAGNLGSAVVKSFLQGNGTVCGLDHRKRRMEGLFESADKRGNFHPFEEIDVTDRDAMVALASMIHDQFGRVDVLVNTVGGFTAGEGVYEISPASWQRMMGLNVQSLLNISAAFIPGMLENKQGKVITIGSKASLQGSAKNGAYAAAKSVVLRLTESLAAELKAYNIQANCVLPGTIDTPDNRQAMPNADFEKWVKPEKIAEAILFLASPASDAISGMALPVYGKS